MNSVYVLCEEDLEEYDVTNLRSFSCLDYAHRELAQYQARKPADLKVSYFISIVSVDTCPWEVTTWTQGTR